MQYTLNPDDVNKQIDFHLGRIPKGKLPAHIDLDDLRQEIYIVLLKRLPQFDPEKSSLQTFQDRLIVFQIKEYFKSFRWQKRQSGESLPSDDAPMVPRVNERKHGELKAVEQAVFGKEVMAVIDGMNEQQRKCCYLMMHYPEQFVADRLQLKGKNFNRLVKSIRAVFVKSNVRPGNFLENG